MTYKNSFLTYKNSFLTYKNSQLTYKTSFLPLYIIDLQAFKRLLNKEIYKYKKTIGGNRSFWVFYLVRLEKIKRGKSEKSRKENNEKKRENEKEKTHQGGGAVVFRG